jgi:hypothetical protein
MDERTRFLIKIGQIEKPKPAPKPKKKEESNGDHAE